MAENMNLRPPGQFPLPLMRRLYHALLACFGTVAFTVVIASILAAPISIFWYWSHPGTEATPREIQAIIVSFNLPGPVEALHSYRDEDSHGKPSTWYVFKITPEAADAAPEIIPAWLREHNRGVRTVYTSESGCIIPRDGPKWWNPQDYSDVKRCCAGTFGATYWMFWSRHAGLLFFHEFRI